MPGTPVRLRPAPQLPLPRLAHTTKARFGEAIAQASSASEDAPLPLHSGSDDATRKPERPHEMSTRMGLADRLQNTPQRIHGKPCSIGALEDSLEGDELQALQSMLHELGWSATRIYDALAAEGHHVGAQSINRHRARSCRCFKASA